MIISNKLFLPQATSMKNFFKSEFEIGSRSFVLNFLGRIFKGCQELFYKNFTEDIKLDFTQFMVEPEAIAATKNKRPNSCLN